MKSPSFSIVIPTFERRDVVCDAVEALCRVRYAGKFDVTVVVDGSTDDSARALGDVAAPFPLRIVEQPNSGAALARARGAAESGGEIILFLDDDMMARPDILEQHAQSYAAGTDAVLGDIPLDPRSPPTFLAEAAARWASERAERLRREADISPFEFLTGHLSIRRSVFEAIGGFDPQFTQGGTFGNEDLDLGARLAGRYRVVFNPDAVAAQRYVVTPRAYLRQWREAGAADVRFARKHPHLERELFAVRDGGAAAWLHRSLAASPAVSNAISRAALSLADRERTLARGSRRLVGHLFRHARDIAYWTGVRQAGAVASGSSVSILCYHAIADLSGDRVLAEYGIDRDRFAGQLDDLRSRGFVFITPDQLLSFVEGKSGVPRKAVLLTFDDCYEELTDVARSVLEPRGIRAIAFAVTGMQSGTNEWDQAIGARKLRLLDTAGLRELRSLGVEIGCHSRTHRPMSSLATTELLLETSGAADDIEASKLPRPRFFAYPHGDHDERVRKAVRDAGFAAAFALAPRRVAPDSDRFALPRVEILARDMGRRFRLKTGFPRAARVLLFRPALKQRAIRLARAARRLAAVRS